LLRLAEGGTYRPLWSAEILEEVERNILRLGVPKDRATNRMNAMRTDFPDAEVTGYESLIGSMTDHPKDCHVLAAAVHAHAAVIVTANLRDFPSSALEPYGIEAMHPDDFLLNQLDLYPRQVAHCLRRQMADLVNPPLSPNEFLTSLRRTVPRFAQAVDAHGLLT
jgi:predicted nucleic acid-binding protein